MHSWVLLSISTCGADPDLEFAPGNCAQSCAGAKIASSEMRIRMLTPEKLTAQCHSTGTTSIEDYPSEIPLRFIVEKPLKTLPVESATDVGSTADAGAGVLSALSSGEGGGESQNTADAQTSSGSEMVPMAAISFQAMILAGTRGEQTENSSNGGDPIYKGIITSQELWCTDSCGVGTIRIKPRCVPESTNIVTVAVTSGSVLATAEIEVTQP